MNHTTGNIRYPFRLVNAFFIKLEASRPPEVQGASELNFSIQIKVVDDRFPERLQLNLRVETTADQPIVLRAELVGLFDLVEGHPVPGPEIIHDFVNERALFQLWPYISQKIRNLSVDMAANPVVLSVPYYFDIAASGRGEEEE